MDETIQIEAIDARSAIRPVVLTLKEPTSSDSPCFLAVHVDGEWDFEASRECWVDALAEVRTQAEAEGVRLLCAGARRNAVVSRMSRSMGRGRKAYLVEYGVPSSPDTLTDIFAPIGVEDYATVGEQQAFTDKWYSYFRSQ